MPKFEYIRYLPPYGPPPENIGWEHPREGFVVQFTPDKNPGWVGNFSPRINQFNSTFIHPNGSDIIVIAGGQAYVIDPETRAVLKEFGGMIENTFVIPELQALVFGDPWGFWAIDPKGLMWKTPNISIDGMRNLNREGFILSGEVTDEGNSWLPFSIDLRNGNTFGGILSYKFREGLTVKLISFNGLLKPKDHVPPEENYFRLIGETGVVKQSPKEKYLFAIISKKARLLIKFDVDLSKMGLIAHNEIENALWILTTDIVKVQEYEPPVYSR